MERGWGVVRSTDKYMKMEDGLTFGGRHTYSMQMTYSRNVHLKPI